MTLFPIKHPINDHKYPYYSETPLATTNGTTEQGAADKGIFDKEIENYKQVTKKANDTYKAISFTETDGGLKKMTMGATHP